MLVNRTRYRNYAAAAGLLLSFTSFNATAQSANQAWVTDELSTYVRSGPTDGYRIIGTLNAGEQVEVLETSGDYTRVRNNDGNAVWVLSNELQQTPSAVEQLPALEAQVEELTAELEGINETWEQRTASMTETLEVRERRIAELEASNQELDAQAEQSRRQVRALQARLETQEEDLLMRYFMYGGGVAGAGLLVGLIVPHLPRRRKKRDRWF
ncbi:SH3 domain-containing protein [Halomonas sp. FeN2]|jgi:SH3 domain protein|uniref:TIGR04211 family SH3 domain-containing protein n=1 Tax=Vreelandella neptunia TaxID=115551 RepID=A0ABZ0YI63_9GAMM|nr:MULTISPECIES: TIGR04211 family SH3 domain-containing protein [Halomonas]TDV93673.1 SH3 domain protein [Halomonas alkaliantarctica]MBF56781.1 peptide-binding protein [Halomonas sp.]MBL1267811.1 SH3 domain-containing protein [Halomonas sp.]MDN3561456.1 TIGR04211 family SH3 domain-containing protein [Halomonas neptunia]UBR50571.1 SH3 domain-containing protein [Halomonas sp. FeN2]|tara:strand:+ start:3044 stop:3679 length:636 start_codon:yes stop_codon:yes gene_type:complete